MSKHSFKFPRYLLLSLAIISLTAVAIARDTTYKIVVPAPAPDLSSSIPQGEQVAVFAGGCFWGVEAVFEHTKGVSDVISGYSGGSATTAQYEAVSSGQTEHAEAVKITYDPAQISYGQLLKIYFAIAHDPTQVNRQGPDFGSQYRSAIFFVNGEQQRVAASYINQLNQAKVFSKPIATQLVPLKGFYAAEDYHQNFIDRNPNHPYVIVHDLPKLNQLQKQLPSLYKP
jgi:peptide-methionine (S)-S-oxide reductase